MNGVNKIVKQVNFFINLFIQFCGYLPLDGHFQVSALYVLITVY